MAESRQARRFAERRIHFFDTPEMDGPFDPAAGLAP